MHSNYICCPSCHYPVHPVHIKNGKSHCASCGTGYSLQDDIIDFEPNSHFYWGELAEEKLKSINDEMEQTGDWYASLVKHLADRPGLVKYILHPSRLGWLFHCYDETNHQTCLDVGSGWGSLSLGLSRFYDEVYSVERVYERLRFQSVRAKIDEIQNVHFLRGSLLNLPIADHSIDLVVVSGVMEWIGLSKSSLPPGDVQRLFLAELNRVLKPNGRIYLGIENWFGMSYFLRSRDQSRLPFSSLAARPAAKNFSGWVQRRNNKDGAATQLFHQQQSQYRTYTYSHWGYLRLFEQAGFHGVKTYWAWQSYSYPHLSGSLDGKTIRHIASNTGLLANNRLVRWLAMVVNVIPDFGLSLLLKIFSPHFLFIAGRESTKSSSLQETILAHEQDAKSFVRLTLGATPRLKTTYLLLNNRGKVFKSVRVSEGKQPGSGNRFTLEENQGVPGRLMNPYDNNEILLAADWLITFQRSSTKGVWLEQKLTEEIRTLTQFALSLPECQKFKAEICAFERVYLLQIMSYPISVVCEHGDFTPPNLILTPQRKIHAVDWEFFRESGNPLLDIGAFYLSLLRRSLNKGAFSKQPGQNKPLDWFKDRLRKEYSIPLSLTPSYYLLRFIKRFRDGNDNSPVVRHTLAEWSTLLNSVIEYSLSTVDFDSHFSPH